MARASLYVPDVNTFRSHLHKATRARREDETGGSEREDTHEKEGRLLQTGTNYFAFLTRSLEFLILTAHEASNGDFVGQRSISCRESEAAKPAPLFLFFFYLELVKTRATLRSAINLS